VSKRVNDDLVRCEVAARWSKLQSVDGRFSGGASFFVVSMLLLVCGVNV
jgi:hypothetical protein